jgi:hypothetical protein
MITETEFFLMLITLAKLHSVTTYITKIYMFSCEEEKLSLLIVSCPTLKKEATYSSETSVHISQDFMELYPRRQ